MGLRKPFNAYYSLFLCNYGVSVVSGTGKEREDKALLRHLAFGSLDETDKGAGQAGDRPPF